MKLLEGHEEDRRGRLRAEVFDLGQVLRGVHYRTSVMALEAERFSERGPLAPVTAHGQGRHGSCMAVFPCSDEPPRNGLPGDPQGFQPYPTRKSLDSQ